MLRTPVVGATGVFYWPVLGHLQSPIPSTPDAQNPAHGGVLLCYPGLAACEPMNPLERKPGSVSV